MRFDIVTIFPRMFDGPLAEGVVARARERKLLDIRVQDLRDFADPPRRNVDDQPYGGGAGMVLTPEPIYRAVEALRQEATKTAVVALCPDGEVFDQSRAYELADYDQVILLSARYEGFDERIRELATHQISIGDYVLTGGDLGALVVVDAVSRLVPGVVGRSSSVATESFSEGRLDHGSFTRPAVYRKRRIPDVIVSGDHERVAQWRRSDSLRKTVERRPDLFQSAPPTNEELSLMAREQSSCFIASAQVADTVRGEA